MRDYSHVVAWLVAHRRHQICFAVDFECTEVCAHLASVSWTKRPLTCLLRSFWIWRRSRYLVSLLKAAKMKRKRLPLAQFPRTPKKMIRPSTIYWLTQYQFQQLTKVFLFEIISGKLWNFFKTIYCFFIKKIQMKRTRRENLVCAIQPTVYSVKWTWAQFPIWDISHKIF